MMNAIIYVYHNIFFKMAKKERNQMKRKRYLLRIMVIKVLIVDISGMMRLWASFFLLA